MQPPGETSTSIATDDAPFPAAVLGPDATVQRANSAWHRVASGESAGIALGLSDDDDRDFVAYVERSAQTGTAFWIDIDVPVLAEKRWSRCHIWSVRHADGAGPAEVSVAIIPMRESLPGDLSRIDIQHVERILEHTADAITIIGSDLSFRFASGIATRWLGMSGASYEGADALTFVYPEDHQQVIDGFQSCLDRPRESIKARFRVIHQNGDLIWVEAIGTNMFDDPVVSGILVTLNDITELVTARAAAEANKSALEMEKQRYQSLAQFIPTGVFELDDANRLTFSNERFDQLTGLDSADVLPFDLFDERDRDSLMAAFERTRAGATTLTTVRLAGDHYGDEPVWLTIRAVRQDHDRVLASIEDATSQVTKHAELSHRVDHDALTGLPNRESMLEQLEEFTSAHEPIAVLFLDLDNFKDINDGLGHQSGDQVLCEIADRVQAVVRPTDIVGRLHGDEFLIVCRHTSDITTAREIAARVVTAVGEPLDATGQGLIVTGSVGIAMNSATGNSTPEELMVAADLAMYEAKRRGGARSVPFNHDLGKRAADRLRLHGEVQRASELGELEMYYQPIVELATGAVVRSEALVRWHHPTQGFILPARFIPEIEKSDLIDDLGMWVIEQVVAELAATGPASLPINVNVSPRQLADESFAETTLELLERSGVAGSRLTIEITELVMMTDFAPAEKQLRLLQRNGVGVAIDDFGTGYSALGYLQRFPFDQIKIDGLFIDAIDTSPNDRAIVRSLIDLADALGATTIAEKVERQPQIDTLVELGCPCGQGFLLGRPVPRPAAPRSSDAVPGHSPHP